MCVRCSSPGSPTPAACPAVHAGSTAVHCLSSCSKRVRCSAPAGQSRQPQQHSLHRSYVRWHVARRLKDMVLRWLPVTTNKAIDGDAPQLGDSPIKTGEG